MKRKLLSLLLVLAMLLSLACGFALADEPETASEEPVAVGLEDTTAAAESDATEEIPTADAAEPDMEAASGEEAAAESEEPSAYVAVSIELPASVNEADVLPYGMDTYAEAGVWYWIELYGGYTLAPSADYEVDYSYYWADDAGQTYLSCFVVFDGSKDAVTLKITANDSAPAAAKINLELPVGVNESDVFPFGVDTYAIPGEEFWVELYGGYALQLTADV